MDQNNPHLIQYQGSKRLLAPQILQYITHKFVRLVEPFAGMAAISIAVAKEKFAEYFFINDINEPIVRLLSAVVNTPNKLIQDYTNIWQDQFKFRDGHLSHYYHIRNCFNEGEQSAAYMLYILARCVKGSVRYGRNGLFNQSPDKRRHGANPKNLANNVCAISYLLKGKTIFTSFDYLQVLDEIKNGDLIYMDPPYQGVSETRDNRYLSGVDFIEFSNAISLLDRKGIDYIISYDGECGNKRYGKELPSSLNCTKILLNAGISTQSTLLGRRNITYESLYVSNNLLDLFHSKPKQITLWND
jgi:DNA adenine methylase